MKADVYSFGVLTLEIVSGRSCANANHGGDQKLLVEWVGVPPKLLYNLMYFHIFKSSGHIVAAETTIPLYACWLICENAFTPLVELQIHLFYFKFEQDKTLYETNPFYSITVTHGFMKPARTQSHFKGKYYPNIKVKIHHA